MNKKLTLDEVGGRFVSMTAAQRQLFLVTYVHEITILARSYFADKEFELARLCNETLHRIVGHAGSLLRSPAMNDHSTFVEMLVAGAVQNGMGRDPAALVPECVWPQRHRDTELMCAAALRAVADKAGRK